MKKTNFTFRIFEKCLTTILILAGMVFSPAMVNACEMSCGGKQQVSLDENCEAEITAEMILSDGGASCAGATFTVNAKLTMNGPAFATGPTVILDGTYIGQELIIEIESDDAGVINRCWGLIELEDKLAPTIECEDITVSCSDPEGLMPTFVGTDCDPNPVINLIDQVEEQLCDDNFLKTITKTFTATDNAGFTSDPCTQVITVERIDIDAIEFPENLMLIDDNGLACDGDYPKLDDGNPDPLFSGVPKLGRDSLYPQEDFRCNTVVTFSDLVLPEVACVTKIMRTWTISEWVCGMDEVFDTIQIIEIVDDEGPAIMPLNDVSVSTTTGQDCQAMYLLPQVDATDNCKDIDRIDIAYPGGFIGDYDGSEIIFLPVGDNLITVTAYDGCLNSTEETFTVTVEDNTAPVAVCDQNTVVALSSLENGITNVSAISFDDGSYDECMMDRFEVKRMDDGEACGLEADFFDEYVTFCCADIGSNPIVIFRVYDAAGNSNDCMVNVEVQDKLPPTIGKPADMTVNCDLVFDETEQGLINAFGDATFSDNCAGMLERSAFFDIDQCNTGRIVRTFTASDDNGSVSIQQIITFENDSLFDGTTDIEWPEDFDVSDCLDLAPGMATEDLAAVSPDITGRPIVSEDACDMVGADYDDKVFEIFNSSTASCFKIIRTWSVVDWCQTDPNTGRFLTWTWDQVIMVTNETAPTFTTSCDTITVCTFDGECEDGEVMLLMSAEDDCTPAEALAWQYSIDANNDGTFDIISDIITGATANATGDYPIGMHRIVWSVEDRCGNVETCEQLFTVENCKTPTPYCYNGLAIDLMDVEDGGMVEIWASDFDAGSFHQCGLPVVVSFSADTTDKNRVFTCDNFGINDVDIWATAVLADGTVVQDFCSTYIDVQDNMGACDSVSNLVNIGGKVTTEMDESIEEVRVQLDYTDMLPEMTDENGTYSFSSMDPGGSYMVSPTKKSDHMNGVTTTDLLFIQRHILGITILDSPYKMIAADINHDNTISASDLLNLRKNILGIEDKFTNNDSWRFVDQGYSFIDESNPLGEQFSEVYNINNLQSDMKIDFIGVKVGDVNGSVIANQQVNAQVRNASTLEFSMNNSLIKAGETVELHVYGNNFDNVQAFQYSIELAEALDFVQVNAGALNMSQANFGFQSAAKGVITTSWDSYEGVTLEGNDVLFTLVVTANEDTYVSDAIVFNSNITKAEAYGNGSTMDVSLTSREAPAYAASFKLYQNSPNPFSGITNIKFDLPEASAATLNVFDVTGKLVHTIRNSYEKGMNNIELNVADFGVSGVLYYTLQTEDHTATKKMVVLK